MASQNDFVQGINLAGLDTCSGADLEQLIREAEPNSHIGYVLSGATPDVVNNSRYSRYLYCPALGDWPKYYNSTSATWVNVPLASDVVTTGIIANGSVTLAKIDHTAGSALQYLRINASATGVEWTTFTLNDASVTTAKIIPGTSDQVLVTNDAGTATTWSSATSWFDSMSQVVRLDNLRQTGAATDDVIAWDGSEYIAIGVENIIPTNSVALSKLAVSGTAGQVVRVNAGATAFEVGSFSATSVTPGSSNQVLQTNSAGTSVSWATLFTKSTAVAIVDNSTMTHTPSPAITYVPKIIRCVLIPSATDVGYATTDEVDISAFASGTASNEVYPCSFWFDSSTYSFKVILSESADNGPFTLNKSTRNYEAIDITKWNIYFIYSNF